MAVKIVRTASAHWTGGLRDGKGAISLESGAMKDYPYGFAARFEGQKGTNPEELLGAAHADCFTMALFPAPTSRPSRSWPTRPRPAARSPRS